MEIEKMKLIYVDNIAVGKGISIVARIIVYSTRYITMNQRIIYDNLLTQMMDYNYRSCFLVSVLELNKETTNHL